MAKFHGVIGFVRTEETSPGVNEEVSVERDYRGDVIRETRGWEKTQYLNDNITLNNRVSIIADDYAKENLGHMRYVKIDDILWKILNVELARPRIILTVGGIYNGPQN